MIVLVAFLSEVRKVNFKPTSDVEQAVSWIRYLLANYSAAYGFSIEIYIVKCS